MKTSLSKIISLVSILLALALTLTGCAEDPAANDKEDGAGGGKENNSSSGSGENNTNNTARERAMLVTAGYSASYTISYSGEHWFKFVGTGDPVIFETSGNVVDTYINVWDKYDYTDRPILSTKSNDNDGEGQNALITLNSTSGTTYYIKITPKSSTSGNYTFIVKAPTSNIRTNPISVAEGNSSSHTITSSGQHWFVFQGTGETVILETEGNVVTTKMEIYIGDNTSSAFSEKNKISFTTISGTTYYIKITGNSGTYIFNIYNGIGDGSSPSYAIPITVGYSASHTLGFSGEHWFSFLGTGAPVTFETTGNVVDTYINVWDRFDYTDRPILSTKSNDNDGEGQNALVSLNTTLGTTYFIKITPKSSTSGTYIFVVR